MDAEHSTWLRGLNWPRMSALKAQLDLIAPASPFHTTSSSKWADCPKLLVKLLDPLLWAFIVLLHRHSSDCCLWRVEKPCMGFEKEEEFCWVAVKESKSPFVPFCKIFCTQHLNHCEILSSSLNCNPIHRRRWGHVNMESQEYSVASVEF